MALIFPLTVSTFLDQLPIASVSFDLSEPVEVSQSAGGDLQSDSIGNSLWRGQITLGRLTRPEAMQAMALIDAVRGAGRSFFAYHVTYPFPHADPNGAILAGSSPQIRTLEADTRLLSLKGLPAGYQLQRGDYLAFEYRSSPVRYALHRVVDLSVTANGTGNTSAFEVQPNIRPGAAVDAAVSLVKPQCKALIVPNSVQPGSQTRFMTDGIGFQFQQTLR